MFTVPKAIKPDPNALKQIDAKTAELRMAFAALPKTLPDDIRVDVEVYLKAAEWIVRHGEWYTKESPKQTLAVLDAGLARAKAAAEGKTPWRDVRGKPIIRGYRSVIDRSAQPVSLNLPIGYGEEGKTFRTDIVLHGRDGNLTEVKFIAGKEAAKVGRAPSGIVIEPYGRGNNAFRWAGETDVFEGLRVASNGQLHRKVENGYCDPARIVLRGFSMGGAGTWHIGLHHPDRFAVIGPGAGFTTTRGYIGKFPEQLPFSQEKTLHIYDAVDYAENAFNVPVVAYSGEKDGQKAAADNIENALKKFPEKLRFTHLIAPGLAHQMPPEWQAKAESEFEKYLKTGRPFPERVRFVTYTMQYPSCDWVDVYGLIEHYRKSVIDARRDGFTIRVETENIRAFSLSQQVTERAKKLVIDGQEFVPPGSTYARVSGKWEVRNWQEFLGKPDFKQIAKNRYVHGPIDAAFRSEFWVIPQDGSQGWHTATTTYTKASFDRFAGEWDKFLRGKLRVTSTVTKLEEDTLVLFGDPQNNAQIRKFLPHLPITWTKEKLVVNGVEYDPKTHIPVLIYPNPFEPRKYVVLNSGHTFHADAFQGTNALLYPRLGDWAVLKVTPTDKDPAAAEVVASGLFDEFWKFPKK